MSDHLPLLPHHPIAPHTNRIPTQPEAYPIQSRYHLSPYPPPLLTPRYPKQYRFATSVFPAADDDVITSPYNAVLATAELIKHADAVFPADNGALGQLVERAEKPLPSEQQRAGDRAGIRTGIRGRHGHRIPSPPHAIAPAYSVPRMQSPPHAIATACKLIAELRMLDSARAQPRWSRTALPAAHWAG